MIHIRHSLLRLRCCELQLYWIFVIKDTQECWVQRKVGEICQSSKHRLYYIISAAHDVLEWLDTCCLQCEKYRLRYMTWLFSLHQLGQSGSVWVLTLCSNFATGTYQGQGIKYNSAMFTRIIPSGAKHQTRHCLFFGKFNDLWLNKSLYTHHALSCYSKLFNTLFVCYIYHIF